MSTATINLRLSPIRILSAKQASEYCGVDIKHIPVSTVEVARGKHLYDLRDLDRYLDDLKNFHADTDDDIVRRLGGDAHKGARL